MEFHGFITCLKGCTTPGLLPLFFLPNKIFFRETEKKKIVFSKTTVINYLLLEAKHILIVETTNHS